MATQSRKPGCRTFCFPAGKASVGEGPVSTPPVSPAQPHRDSSPSLSCFCSTPSASHVCPQQKNAQRDFPTLPKCCWLFTGLSDGNCNRRTRTSSILMNFSCLIGISSVAVGTTEWRTAEGFGGWVLTGLCGKASIL